MQYHRTLLYWQVCSLDLASSVSQTLNLTPPLPSVGWSQSFHWLPKKLMQQLCAIQYHKCSMMWSLNKKTWILLMSFSWTFMLMYLVSGEEDRNHRLTLTHIRWSICIQIRVYDVTENFKSKKLAEQYNLWLWLPQSKWQVYVMPECLTPLSSQTPKYSLSSTERALESIS